MTMESRPNYKDAWKIGAVYLCQMMREKMVAHRGIPCLLVVINSDEALLLFFMALIGGLPIKNKQIDSREIVLFASFILGVFAAF